MSMDVGGSKSGPKSDINVTPLVDVMLVLLIIMMLVAPMLQKGVDVKLPEAGNTVDKPDSQDICFVPDGDYAGLVKRLRPETAAPGDIVDLDGQVLGQHQGVVHFTIGQRRGIEIGGQPEPLYVVRIEPEKRRLVVGPRRALAVAAAKVEGINWLAENQAEVEAKVRSLARPDAGYWDGARLTFATPEYGVAPGQSVVFYEGERLLGGGTIVATEAAAFAHSFAA